MKQSRWSSPVFWSGLLITIAGILGSFGVFSQDITVKIVSAITALTASFINGANNPENKTGF